MMMRIDHIGIAVKDLDTALSFYRDALGLHLEGIHTVPDQGVEVAMLPAGESAIELIRPLQEDSGLRKWMDKRGEGIHHICLQVDDLQAALARLSAAGYQLIDTTPRKGVEGEIAFVHPKSTRGVLLELIQKEC